MYSTTLYLLEVGRGIVVDNIGNNILLDGDGTQGTPLTANININTKESLSPFLTSGDGFMHRAV